MENVRFAIISSKGSRPIRIAYSMEELCIKHPKYISPQTKPCKLETLVKAQHLRIYDIYMFLSLNCPLSKDTTLFGLNKIQIWRGNSALLWFELLSPNPEPCDDKNTTKGANQINNVLNMNMPLRP